MIEHIKQNAIEFAMFFYICFWLSVIMAIVIGVLSVWIPPMVYITFLFGFLGVLFLLGTLVLMACHVYLDIFRQVEGLTREMRLLISMMENREVDVEVLKKISARIAGV